MNACIHPLCAPPAILLEPGILAAVLLGAWIALSVLLQWGAARADALARRRAPACFRPPVPLPGPEAGIHLAFLGDLQRGVVDVCGPLAEAARERGVDLLVSSGDFVSHGEAPYYGLLLEAFDRAGMDTPMRVVPGNHDLWPRRSKDDDIGGALFEERFGPRHWHVEAGPVLLVGIDTGADWQMEAQLPWLEELLGAHAGRPWICVSHRAPYDFDDPAHPPRPDLEELIAFLAAHPPALFISGHLHRFHDEVVEGVRYIVNAHGGDVHGLALRREDFELLHVRAAADGDLQVEVRPCARRRSWPVARDQFAVRLWSDRRKPLGAFLAWPVGLLLRALGRDVPVIRHPVERRIPSREVLHERRRAIAQAKQDTREAPGA